MGAVLVGGVEGLEVFEETADAAGELDAAREAARDEMNDAALSTDDSSFAIARRKKHRIDMVAITSLASWYTMLASNNPFSQKKTSRSAHALEKKKKVPVSSSVAAAAANSCSAAAAALEISVSRSGKYFFLMLSVVLTANVPERSQISTTRFTFSYKV